MVVFTVDPRYRHWTSHSLSGQSWAAAHVDMLTRIGLWIRMRGMPGEVWTSYDTDGDYGDSAPPGAFSRRCTNPNHRAGSLEAGSRHRASPCSPLLSRSRRSPALSLRPRHGYAADLHHGLPDAGFRTSKEFPANNDGDAPLPAHIRQVRAG